MTSMFYKVMQHELTAMDVSHNLINCTINVRNTIYVAQFDLLTLYATCKANISLKFSPFVRAPFAY